MEPVINIVAEFQKDKCPRGSETVHLANGLVDCYIQPNQRKHELLHYAGVFLEIAMEVIVKFLKNKIVIIVSMKMMVMVILS